VQLSPPTLPMMWLRTSNRRDAACQWSRRLSGGRVYLVYSKRRHRWAPQTDSKRFMTLALEFLQQTQSASLAKQILLQCIYDSETSAAATARSPATSITATSKYVSK
jgi:hypothetical protein